MVLPRIVRQRDAPAYLGMDRNKFNADVRPHLTEIPLGERAIGYDRYELDAWADAYIAACGRPGRTTKGGAVCAPGRKGSSLTATDSGPSTSSIAESGYLNASAKSPKTKPKRGSDSGKTRSTPEGETNFDKAMSSCFGSQRAST